MSGCRIHSIRFKDGRAPIRVLRTPERGPDDIPSMLRMAARGIDADDVKPIRVFAAFEFENRVDVYGWGDYTPNAEAQQAIALCRLAEHQMLADSMLNRDDA
jgi:hypothetical protein